MRYGQRAPRVTAASILGYLRARFNLWRASRIRHIPDKYFVGYRRLALTANEVQGERCWNCRHAVAYVTWWCDRMPLGCEWERCYVAEELTAADVKVGWARSPGWVRLPPE